ncbi:hypothetical protein T09_7450 [Trichinella sp. T9]|nr:hypothetical protein T09_7450 [Trichinella sp. T9]
MINCPYLQFSAKTRSDNYRMLASKYLKPPIGHRRRGPIEDERIRTRAAYWKPTSAAEVLVTESSSSTRRAYRGSASWSTARESRRRQLERIEARQKLRTRKAPYDREGYARVYTVIQFTGVLSHQRTAGKIILDYHLLSAVTAVSAIIDKKIAMAVGQRFATCAQCSLLNATFENAELEMDMSDEMTEVTWAIVGEKHSPDL